MEEGLLFVLIEDVRLSRMSKDWLEVWDGLTTRELFGFYVITQSEFDKLQGVSDDDDEIEFDLLVSDLDWFTRNDLYGLLLDNEHNLCAYVSRCGSDVSEAFEDVFSYGNDYMSFESLVSQVGKALGRVGLFQLDRLAYMGSDVELIGDLLISELRVVN